MVAPTHFAECVWVSHRHHHHDLPRPHPGPAISPSTPFFPKEEGVSGGWRILSGAKISGDRRRSAGGRKANGECDCCLERKVGRENIAKDDLGTRGR